MTQTEELTHVWGETPLRVNDLKQYAYCPRIVYYNTVMPVERKSTVKMERGKDEEIRIDSLEKRRTLKRYALDSGERRFNVWIDAPTLNLSGKLDLLIASSKGFFPVDFKYTRGRPHRNHMVQLAGYALLVEDSFKTSVQTGFVYLVALQEIVAIALTPQLKEHTVGLLKEIRMMVRERIIPLPTSVRARCEECEFRNYCGDIF